MKNLYYLFRRRNPKLLKTCYHEMGHFLLVHLFSDDFEMNIITANKKMANNKVVNSNGGLGFVLKTTETIDVYDKICVIGLAGMCSQNLFFADNENKSHAVVIPVFIESPDSEMNNEGGIGDFEIVQQNLYRIFNLKKINLNTYRKELLAFCFDYLSDEKVWNIAGELVDFLIKKWNLTLEKKEIVDFLEKNNLLKELEKINLKYLNSRYPINRN